MEKFLEEIIEIIGDSRKRSFGNGVLYEISKNEEPHCWGNKSILTDKLWLIGRSYSVSLERRYKLSTDTDDETRKKINHGKGKGTFFSSVAANMIENKRYKDVMSEIKTLKNLKFDESEEDKKNFKKAIDIVNIFNDLCVDSIEKFDMVNNSEIYSKLEFRNHFSFSSKFLHFHLPNNVFILDRYSREGGELLFSNKTKIKLNNDIIAEELKESFVKRYEELYRNIFKAENKDKNLYAKHCIREYILCCFLKKNLREKIENSDYPNYIRLVDRIFQRIQ